MQRACRRLRFASLWSAVGILVLLAFGAGPATAQTERLEVIPEVKPAEMLLTRGEPGIMSVAVRNPGENAFEIKTIDFVFEGEIPPEVPRPKVAYAKGVSLAKNQTMTVELVFPVYWTVTEYGGQLWVTRGQPGAQPELFHAFRIKVQEKKGATLPRRLSGWIATLLAAVVVVLPFVIRGAHGTNFFQSSEKHYSISRFQVWLWTAVILFSFAFLFFTVGPNVEIPQTLLGLMGISVGSISTATTIAIRGGGPARKHAAGAHNSSAAQSPLSSMLSENGEPSAMRLQMFAWTIAMVVFFIWRVFSTATLWDIPPSLLILIGVSHGGYLLDKGVRSSK